jgi:hypothetical protein
VAGVQQQGVLPHPATTQTENDNGREHQQGAAWLRRLSQGLSPLTSERLLISVRVFAMD